MRRIIPAAFVAALVATPAMAFFPEENPDLFVDVCPPEFTGHGTATECQVAFYVSTLTAKPNALLDVMRAIEYRGGKNITITQVPSFVIDKNIYPYGPVQVSCKTTGFRGCFTGFITLLLPGAKP